MLFSSIFKLYSDSKDRTCIFRQTSRSETPEQARSLSEQLVPTRPAEGGAMLYRPRTEGIFARIKRFRLDQDAT